MNDFTKYCYEADKDILSHFFHAESYKAHLFFKQHPHAFALHLCVDAFELANPLGSHITTHKVEAMYLVVQNFPSKSQSKLSSIFVVALWHALDVKSYNGYDKILAPVVNSLRNLESADGIKISIRGQQMCIRACLVLFSVDNLGFNSLFGFNESFRARKFCRFCDSTREAAETCYEEKHFMLRTRNAYNYAVSIADPSKKATSSANTGVKRGCILNQLQHFHVTSNWVVDAMHDILEGVAPFKLSLILEALNVLKYIELDIVNKEIKTFNFSIADMDSVPPTLSSFTSIKMSATEK